MISQEKLDLAKRDVDRAQTEVDRLQHKPSISEPSALDQMEKVRIAIPLTPPPAKSLYQIITLIIISLLANNPMTRSRTALGH